MYKIIENNLVIDVVEKLQFVKCLAKSKRMISVDERQANGIMSSDGKVVYHIAGTPNTFAEAKHSIRYVEIDEDEYNKLTTQMKTNNDLEHKVEELERIILELRNELKGR